MKKQTQIEMLEWVQGLAIFLAMAIVLMLFISFTSAIYSGETTTIYSNLDKLDNYTFSGNTSSLNTLLLEDNLSLNITIPQDFSGEINVTFNGWKTETIQEASHGGSGGGNLAWYLAHKNVIKNNTAQNNSIIALINQTANINNTSQNIEDVNKGLLTQGEKTVIWLSLLGLLIMGIIYLLIKPNGGIKNESTN